MLLKYGVLKFFKIRKCQTSKRLNDENKKIEKNISDKDKNLQMIPYHYPVLLVK